jgi:hypothetical protein
MLQIKLASEFTKLCFCSLYHEHVLCQMFSLLRKSTLMYCLVDILPSLISVLRFLYGSGKYFSLFMTEDRLCGLVVRVLDYRSRGPGFDSRHYQNKKKVVGLERGPLSLVSTTEEPLDRKVAAPV